MSVSPPSGFSGDWVTADHPEYAQAISRWAANAQRRAKVVAFVKSAADVALALNYAKGQALPIAVRGGGHSAAGASSSEGGLVVDLSRYLSGVRVDPDQKLGYIGGGAVWETVDKAAIQHGLATVGGTVNHTGVGGLTLGGGYGFLTGEHGLALDNLVQATIVSADEKTRTVNATENPDLYWGLRGGGSNFGVVTEFVLQLHPQRRTVFAGFAIYSASALSKLVPALAEWWEKGPSAKETVIHAIVSTPGGQANTMLQLFWNGSEEEGRRRFKAFFDIGPIADTCREIPYEELNSLQNANVSPGGNYFMKGVFTSGPQQALADSLLERASSLSEKNGHSLAVFFEYFPTNKFITVPNSATAHIRGARVSTLIFGSWANGDEDKLPAVRAAANELIDVILRGETRLSAVENTGYVNYIADEPALKIAGAGSTVGAERLFGENYPRLQQLKKQYDPTLLFSKWCPITPAA